MGTALDPVVGSGDSWPTCNARVLRPYFFSLILNPSNVKSIFTIVILFKFISDIKCLELMLLEVNFSHLYLNIEIEAKMATNT